MPCESCHVQFGLITRKKTCYECRRLFCRNCLEKRQERILCQNCLIFTKRPLLRIDLGPLKVKDLIFFLQSKHISTTGCVEKDDLINLVIEHVNSGHNSPQSPQGSAGSGNGGRFHFSSASSTGGSSGGGGGGAGRQAGGRGSHSGGSSRYGNFYSASAENCANTFDQIKNTCQNLFSSITDKLSSDTPKPPNFSPRFSNSSTEENLRRGSNHSGQQNVFQQPRFGSNDIHHQNHAAAAAAQHGTTSIPSTPGSNDGARRTSSDIVPNERTFSPTAAVSNRDEDSAGSGITSGADSSANTSSVSSPEHQLPRLPEGQQNRSLSERIDSMLASDANQNGCDCSDEEDEEHEGPRRKECKKEVPEALSPVQPGPSQGSSCAQEEDAGSLALVAVTTPNGGELVEMQTLATSEEPPDVSAPCASNEILPATVPTTEPVGGATSFNNEVNPNDVPVSNRTPRRHSDSSLLQRVAPNASGTAAGSQGLIHCEEQLPPQSSQQTTTTPSLMTVITNKCFKCGKRRNGIRKQLKKFRKQLETATGTEVDKRRQLEVFLNYLERRSKGSLELSDTESITEDASVSIAEGEPMEIAVGASGAASVAHFAGEGSSHSSYSRDERHDERINVYSSGNQELASMSHIKLSDIKESADLDILSVKQLKEILMLNRVDFKGCCEKPELRERVLRLWRDFKSIPSIEKLPSDDLCKICMDAPIECVILECGHMTTCTACGKVLSECPICRQYIVRVVRFFRA